MDVMSLFGGMKDTYECLNLIREIAQRYVSKRLIEDYGDYFHVNASIVSERKMSRKDTNKSDETEKVRVKIVKRDAFFYYLLVSNIGMIAILAGLVYKAVATMYWG